MPPRLRPRSRRCFRTWCTRKGGLLSSAFAGTTVDLPPQLPRQRPRRMAEQFFHRGRVELIDALEILGVDAAGDEQAVDAKTVGAGEISAHRIPDRQHAAK